MPQKDRAKARADWNRWYQRNKKTHIKRVRACDKKRRLRLREWLAEYKSKLKCETCSFAHPAALDFHHTRGEKEFSIGDALRSGWSIERLEKEISKCRVLCANCHRIHHYEERMPR